MLKAFSKIGYDVELTFPNRAKNKISAESIYDFYNIREKISLNITKYYIITIFSQERIFETNEKIIVVFPQKFSQVSLIVVQINISS